jgi:hypothetical protein
MNGGAYSLTRLRRSSSGAARYVVGLFVVASLSVGVAPCAMAASEAVQAERAASHEHEHDRDRDHEPRVGVAHAQHAHEGYGVEAGEHAPAPADDGTASCPHCLAATAGALEDDHSSCFAVPDLTNAAAQAKDAPQQLAPAFGPPAFTLPPALAAPRAPPPLRRLSVPAVPLNIRNCVFLI